MLTGQTRSFAREARVPVGRSRDGDGSGAVQLRDNYRSDIVAVPGPGPVLERRWSGEFRAESDGAHFPRRARHVRFRPHPHPLPRLVARPERRPSPHHAPSAQPALRRGQQRWSVVRRAPRAVVGAHNALSILHYPRLPSREVCVRATALPGASRAASFVGGGLNASKGAQARFGSILGSGTGEKLHNCVPKAGIRAFRERMFDIDHHSSRLQTTDA